jgi:hypothetical protein
MSNPQKKLFLSLFAVIFLLVIFGATLYGPDTRTARDNSVSPLDNLIKKTGEICNEKNLLFAAWSKLRRALDIKEARAQVTCTDVQESIARLRMLRDQILRTTDFATLVSLYNQALSEIDHLLALINAAGLSKISGELNMISAEVAKVREAVENIEIDVNVEVEIKN